MRLLLPLAVAALLVAGCTAPSDDKEDDPLFGLCPQWAHGPGGTTGSLQLGPDGNRTVELGPAADRYLDRPLDVFRVTISKVDVDGVLELRAEDAAGGGLSLRDYRLEDVQVVPVVTIGADAAGHEFDVFLSPVIEDGPTAPLPATLHWDLDGAGASVEYEVSYHYKVCGA